MKVSSRDVHKFYAQVNHYFWLPCPTCGEEFGGHEWGNVEGHDSTIPDREYPGDMSRGEGICPNCTALGVGCKAWADAGVSPHAACEFLVGAE